MVDDGVRGGGNGPNPEGEEGNKHHTERKKERNRELQNIWKIKMQLKFEEGSWFVNGIKNVA